MSVQMRPADEVHYPDSDGVPVGETGTHGEAIMDFVHQLKWHFREQQDVYVGSDQFWYFEQGNPRSVVCPDVYVVFGVPSRPPRDLWKTWEDHCFPSVVFEFTSRSTRKVDTGFKKDLYERLGVDELWLFDPFGEYLRPRLQGWRREGGRFVAVEPDAEGRYASRALAASLQADEMRVVLRNSEGVGVPPFSELSVYFEAARDEAEHQAQRADQEAQRADQEARRADRLAERLRALGVEDEG